MTDKEKLVVLLHDFGIEPEVTKHEVSISANTPGVAGYIGFYCEFKFSEDGAFSEVGVWE